MQIGRHRLAWRRWSFYIDTDDQWIGRYPGEHAVFYALLCLVARHDRPDHYAEARAVRDEQSLRRRRGTTVGAWQTIRDQIWAELAKAAGDAEPSWDDLARRYDARAGDARARFGYKDPQTGWWMAARDGWIPTLDELRIYREPINIKPRQPSQPSQQTRPRSVTRLPHQ